MPSEQAHIKVARANQTTLEYLLHNLADHSPWVVTVAFYKALHVAEAVFAGNPEIGHRAEHRTRNRTLKVKYGGMWRHYRRLWSLSCLARYLADGEREVQSFSDYMKPDEVKAVAVDLLLMGVQRAAAAYLSAESLQALGLPPPERARKTHKQE